MSKWGFFYKFVLERKKEIKKVKKYPIFIKAISSCVS
jgi:hypothetical protein